MSVHSPALISYAFPSLLFLRMTICSPAKTSSSIRTAGLTPLSLLKSITQAILSPASDIISISFVTGSSPLAHTRLPPHL